MSARTTFGHQMLFLMPFDVQNIVFVYLDMDDVTEFACVCKTTMYLQVVPSVITLPWREKKKLRNRFLMGPELWVLNKRAFESRPTLRLNFVSGIHIKAQIIQQLQNVLQAKNVFSLFREIKLILIFDRDFLGIFGPKTCFMKSFSKLADGFPAIFHLCYNRNMLIDAWNLNAQMFLQSLVSETSPDIAIHLVSNIPITGNHGLTMKFLHKIYLKL